MRDDSAETLDRLVAGDLSRDEERRLAQAALDDPDLFDTLTAAAVTKIALAEAQDPLRRPDVIPFDGATSGTIARNANQARRRPSRAVLAAIACAAAVVLAVAYGWSTLRRSAAPPSNTSASAPIPQPTLLLARVDAGNAATFRTETTRSREPKTSGTVVRTSGSVADLDVGAIDGLREGLEVEVFRGQRHTGGVRITTVFRDRARGRFEGSDVHTGDRLAIDPGLHVGALMEQVAASQARGDAAGAHDLAALAVLRAQAAGVPGDVRRRALFALATLAHQQRDASEAARLLQQDVDLFDTAPAASAAERGDVLNELGSIHIERRDLALAERSLQAAQSAAEGPGRIRAANNLGALAALRGDRAGAERWYRTALSLAGETPDLAQERQAIQTNLAALQAAR